MTSSAMPVTGAGLAGRAAPAARASFAGAVRSEFTKLRSVRSTYWGLISLIVVSTGIGALGCWAHAQRFSQLPAAVQAGARAGEIANATADSLFGLVLGQLVIAVLGALVITSEYSTGMIRTSLSVLPRRGTLLAAKATVFGLAAVATGLVTSFASYAVGQAVLSGAHINSALSQPGVLRAVIGGGLFLAACGLLAFGIGALLRHTAGAITTVVAMLFVLFILSGFLPSNWAEHVDRWIPFNAGGAIWENLSAPHMFGPWTGFAVFCCYAAAAITAGAVAFARRDA